MEREENGKETWLFLGLGDGVFYGSHFLNSYWVVSWLSEYLAIKDNSNNFLPFCFGNVQLCFYFQWIAYMLMHCCIVDLTMSRV